MKKLLFVLILTLPLLAQPADDLDAIRATALDYAEGWYSGDGDRMARSLHPDLAKRNLVVKDSGATVRNLTAEQLTKSAHGGDGKNVPAEQQQRDVKVLDRFGNTASVRLEMRDWIDYMHMVKMNGRWVIVNVLWEMKPKK